MAHMVTSIGRLILRRLGTLSKVETPRDPGNRFDRPMLIEFQKERNNSPTLFAATDVGNRASALAWWMAIAIPKVQAVK